MEEEEPQQEETSCCEPQKDDDGSLMDDPDDFELYRLDSERVVRAAGGEELNPGDHVYMWCTLYQHHGIILSIDDTTQKVWIAEFTNVALLQANTFVVSSSTASGAVSGGGVTGGFRFVLEDDITNKWHKVKYNASPMECLTWRPGTCSANTPSSAEIILRRVQFLRDCRHLLPEYHLLASNCETVATWCVTGKWETLQYIGHSKLSQAALAATGGGVGMVAAGIALWHSSQIQQKWHDTAERLDQEFQWYSMGRHTTLTIITKDVV